MIAKETIVVDINFLDKKTQVAFDPDEIIIGVVSPVFISNTFALQDVAGAAAELYNDDVDLRPFLTGDYLHISGFAADENNGSDQVWQATGDGTKDTLAIVKLDSENPVAEAAGRTIRVHFETLYTYDIADPMIVRNGVGDYTAYLPTRGIAGEWGVEVVGRRSLGGTPERFNDQRIQLRRKLRANIAPNA